jgi:hypothetical protein
MPNSGTGISRRAESQPRSSIRRVAAIAVISMSVP